MQKKEFGEKLLTLRKAKKVSQSEVANFINLTVAAYQNYENGRREAGYETIVKLADFYGVTTDYLLGREPLPDPFADLNLHDEDEKEVIDKYMSLPSETRAIILDVIRQLGGVMSDKDKEEQPTLMRTTTAGEMEDRLKSEQEAEKDGEKFA